MAEPRESLNGRSVSSEQPFGERLKALRQARGLSLGALARASGVSDSTLSRWESGKRQPHVPELEAVLDALEASASVRRDLFQQITAPRALVRLRETNVAAAPPVGGDLLQALRLRRGWTQADAARAVGVHQTQIARWEHGDAWPDAEKLHVLCWHLHADEEELAELARITGDGQFRPASDLGHQEPDLPPPGSNLPLEAAQPWARYVGGYLASPPHPFLLRILHLQHRLSSLASHHPFAEQLLPNAYAIQARHHLAHHEMRQAVSAAQRGLALARRHRLRASSDTGTSIWFGSVIVLATVAAESGAPAGLRQAVRLLNEWLPAVKDCPSHHAWGSAELAWHNAKLGSTDEATGLSKSVCQQASHDLPGEYRYRLQDHARVLGQVGRPREALRILGTSRDVPAAPNDQSHYFDLRQELLEAQCLAALKDRDGTDERLRAAAKIVHRNRNNKGFEDFVRATVTFKNN